LPHHSNADAYAQANYARHATRPQSRPPTAAAATAGTPQRLGLAHAYAQRRGNHHHPGTGFTQNGNAIVRDLLYDKYTNKQFIAVETKDGNTFYVVIDYDKPVDEDANLYEHTF
jgi:hypothetical protein